MRTTRRAARIPCRGRREPATRGGGSRRASRRACSSAGAQSWAAPPPARPAASAPQPDPSQGLAGTCSSCPPPLPCRQVQNWLFGREQYRIARWICPRASQEPAVAANHPFSAEFARTSDLQVVSHGPPLGSSLAHGSWRMVRSLKYAEGSTMQSLQTSREPSIYRLRADMGVRALQACEGVLCCVGNRLLLRVRRDARPT